MPVFHLAEGVGFEPTDPLRSPVFKTGALDHYATLPNNEKFWRCVLDKVRMYFELNPDESY